MAASDEASNSTAEGSSSQCVCLSGKSNWHRRNRKELDDFSTINHSPWRPTLQYACLLITLSLVMPIFVQMVFMSGYARWELQHKASGTDTSKVRIDPQWFHMVFLFPLVSVLFLVWLLFPWDDNKWQRAIRNSADEFVEVFRPFFGPARTDPGDTPGPTYGVVTRFAFALLAGLVSWAAWYGPLTWWWAAAVQYRTCHHLCAQEVHTSGGATEHDVFHEACIKHMALHPKQYPAALYISSEGTDTPKQTGNHSRALCKTILQAEMTKYTEHMLQRGHTFLAFESNVRQHYAISCVDIFGAALELGLLILVLSARAALREQYGTLQQLRVQYIKDHMVSTTNAGADLDEWIKFFKMLRHQLQRSDPWTLKVLQELKNTTTDAERDKVFDKYEDKNLNDISDESENYIFSSCWSIFFTSFAFVCALLDALVPFLSRRLFHKNRTVLNPDADWHFSIISGVSIIATFLGAFSSFFLFSSAYVRNKSQINAVIAFDCLFRFPFHHPQTTVLVSGGQSLATYLASRGSGRDRSGQTASSSPLTGPGTDGNDVESAGRDGGDVRDGNYFAHFTDLSKMNSDLKNFNFYFLGRQYLQLDKVDERNCLETAMVVALLSLIPRLLIVLCNVGLETGNRKYLQPVNVAFMWRLGYVFLMSILSLLETMTLNEHFGNHHKKLQGLLDYTTYSERLERQENQAAELIKHLVALMESHDLPSTLFGVKVRWHMLAGFVGVWSLSVPQLAIFVGELIEYIGEKV